MIRVHYSVRTVLPYVYGTVLHLKILFKNACFLLRFPLLLLYILNTTYYGRLDEDAHASSCPPTAPTPSPCTTRGPLGTMSQRLTVCSAEAHLQNEAFAAQTPWPSPMGNTCTRAPASCKPTLVRARERTGNRRAQRQYGR